LIDIFDRKEKKNQINLKLTCLRFFFSGNFFSQIFVFVGYNKFGSIDKVMLRFCLNREGKVFDFKKRKIKIKMILKKQI